MKQKRKLVIVLAILIYLAMVPVSISFYNNYKVFEHGHLVSVEITGSDGSNLDFMMNGKKFSKKLNKYSFESYRKGEAIQLKYLEGFEHNFLFRNENPLTIYPLLIAMMLIMSCYFIFYFFFKKKGE